MPSTTLQSSSICTFDRPRWPSHKMASLNPVASNQNEAKGINNMWKNQNDYYNIYDYNMRLFF